MKKKYPEEPQSIIHFIDSVMIGEGKEILSQNDGSDTLAIRTAAVRIGFDGEIQDVELRTYRNKAASLSISPKRKPGEKIENLSQLDPVRADMAKQLNQRSFDRIPERLYMGKLHNLMKCLISAFIKGEHERLDRIEQLDPEDIRSVNKLIKNGEPFTSAQKVTVPERRDLLDKFEPKVEYFNQHIGNRIYLAIAQVALEAHGINQKKKVTKASVKNTEDWINLFRREAIKSNLQDGRGNTSGAERFDRVGFLSKVEQAIVNLFKQGKSSREVTQKVIAHALNLGKIEKGTGVDVLRKRLRLCGIKESWGTYVESVIQQKRKRKPENQK